MTGGAQELAVVVVAYRSAGELPATLAAVSAQLEPGDELIVVDNASPDDSAAVARAAAPHADVVRLERNTGFAGGCNTGAQFSQAPLLFFLNPDARVRPGAIAALRAAAIRHPGWGAWQALVLLEGGERINTAGGATHWTGLAWAGGCEAPAADVGVEDREVSFASGAALVVRRTAWRQVGGFDPAYFMYGEDVDLSLRLRLAGWRIGLVPTAAVEHAYEFTKGSYKWFYLERNRWWTVIGAYPGGLIALVAPALLLLEVALLPVAAAGGWLPAKLRAQAAVLASLPWAWRRRRRVQATRSVSPGAFAEALSATLDSPYLGGPAASPPLKGLQAGYWRVVRRLLQV